MGVVKRILLLSRSCALVATVAFTSEFSLRVGEVRAGGMAVRVSLFESLHLPCVWTGLARLRRDAVVPAGHDRRGTT